MKERVYKGNLIFEIESDGDKYDLFEKAVAVCRSITNLNEIKYYTGFFDDASFWFIYENIDARLEYSGFMGTELKVSEDIDKKELEIIRQLATRIYEEVNS